MPNSGLFIKVFNKQTFKREDLSHVDIYSVATLMQEALWSSHERIVSKKAWRIINYESKPYPSHTHTHTQKPLTLELACTLSKLSLVISNKSEQFLIEILDFLVTVMHYKHVNLMDAYKLGDALGKVVLGPSDCGPIMAEKAGHFLTRMIIEHAKIQHYHYKSTSVLRRKSMDSGFDDGAYNEHQPICKAQGTIARAKFYNRDIKKTQWATFDWCDNAVGVRAMLDNDYEDNEQPQQLPWVSIFSPSADLIKKIDHPILSRILREALKPTSHMPSHDPFESFFLQRSIELHESFHEFHAQLNHSKRFYHGLEEENSHPLKKKLNHSLSHLKLNIKKYRSRQDLLSLNDDEEENNASDGEDQQETVSKANDSMISVMKKMMKFSGISQHSARSSNIVI